MSHSHTKLFKFPAKVTICLIFGAIIVIFATLPDTFFPLLSLERKYVAQGELWRLITSSTVHFGWAHTLMNLAAFAIFATALSSSFTQYSLLGIIVFCCTLVGVGVYWLNPEYETYAGLSGAIHGFFVAGLILNKRHAYWLNGLMIAALFTKIAVEHQPNYQATEIQSLLPVAVAYDAHLYGAIAGAMFGFGNLLLNRYFRVQLH